MTSINDIYNEWLRAEDLGPIGSTVQVTIENWSIHDFKERDGSTKKQIALNFVGKQKQLGLNVTNAKRIARIYGDQIENWIGQPITLYVEEVEAFGKFTPAIRVAQPQPQMQQPTGPAGQATVPPQSLQQGVAQVVSAATPPRAPGVPDDGYGDIDDDIPFS